MTKRKACEMFLVSQDDPSSDDAPPPIAYKDIIKSPIFAGAEYVHVDPEIVPPVRNQGDCVSCMCFAGCDASSAAFLIVSKKRCIDKGQKFEPVLLAPQGPIDLGPQNQKKRRNKDPSKVYPPTDWDLYEYGQATGFFLDRDLPYQLKRVQRVPQSLTSLKRLKYDVPVVDHTTLHLPETEAQAKKLIQLQPCVAHIRLSPKFANHKGCDIFRDREYKEGEETHAVLVLGYGYDENAQLYAIIKNSGYLTFGYYGYARVQFNLLMDFSAPLGEYFKWV